MGNKGRALELKFERLIPATPGEAFDAWLDPKVTGNPWNIGDELILEPKAEKLYYLGVDRFGHYGRFIEVERPGRIRHTWVSPNTLGMESMVTATFKKKGAGTLMALVHTGIPNTEEGKGHQAGWDYFLDQFPKHFNRRPKK